MEQLDLKAFRKANGLSQVALAEYLGVGQSFISQIEKGDRPMPKEYISTILANAEWDTSMLEAKPHRSIGLLSGLSPITHFHKAVAENLGSTIREVLEDNVPESPLVVYLEQQNREQAAIIKNQDATIRDLLKHIEVLKKENDALLAEIKSVRKGDATSAAGSLSADAV